MIRIIDFRLVIEKRDTHNKYYPQVVSFNTVDALPLSAAPSATITINTISNLNDVATASLIEFDDIVRLQASVRYNVLEHIVWVDLFQGRVQNQSKDFGENNTITLSCEGHIAEIFYKMLKVSSTFSNVDASAILAQLIPTNLSRISYNSSLLTSGQPVDAYNTEAEQNYMIDVCQEMEKLSGYKWMVDVLPVYHDNGNLDTSYLRWRPLDTVATPQYSIIEGTPRLLSASFDVVGEDVANYRYVKGGDNGSGVQYANSYYDGDSVTNYGERYKIDTFSWIKSSVTCYQIAQGLTSDTKIPYVAGQAVLEGTVDAHLGDLVQVKIPSLAIQEIAIDGYYTVSKVTHSYTGGEFKTTLDLGRIKKTEYDYISTRLTQVLYTAYKNQVKLN